MKEDGGGKRIGVSACRRVGVSCREVRCLGCDI